MTPRLAALWVTLQLLYVSLLTIGGFLAWMVLRRVDDLNRKIDQYFNHRRDQESR